MSASEEKRNVANRKVRRRDDQGGRRLGRVGGSSFKWPERFDRVQGTRRTPAMCGRFTLSSDPNAQLHSLVSQCVNFFLIELINPFGSRSDGQVVRNRPNSKPLEMVSLSVCYVHSSRLLQLHSGDSQKSITMPLSLSSDKAIIPLRHRPYTTARTTLTNPNAKTTTRNTIAAIVLLFFAVLHTFESLTWL